MMRPGYWPDRPPCLSQMWANQLFWKWLGRRLDRGNRWPLNSTARRRRSMLGLDTTLIRRARRKT